MSIFRMLWLATIVLGVGSQFVMLSLQTDALRRYRHRSFWLLGFGTACLAVYASMAAIPFFITLSQVALVTLTSIALGFGTVGVIFGVLGTASLFQAFGQLYQASLAAEGKVAK